MKRGIMHRTSDAAALLIGIVVALLCLTSAPEIGHLTGSAVAGLAAVVLALVSFGRPRGHPERIATALTVGFITGSALWWPVAYLAGSFPGATAPLPVDQVALLGALGVGSLAAVVFAVVDRALAPRPQPVVAEPGVAEPVVAEPAMAVTPVMVASPPTPDDVEAHELEPDIAELEEPEETEPEEQAEEQAEEQDSAIETDDTVVIPVPRLPESARRAIAADFGLEIDGEPSVLPRRAMPRNGAGVPVAS